MTNNKESRNSLSRKLLFFGYILLCVVGSICVLRILFPERWEQLFHGQAVSRLEDTEIRADEQLLAAKLHKVLANSRWPVGAYRYHKAIGFDMTPGFCAKMRNNLFSICSHQLGYRIPAFESRSSFEKGGVLSIGCSFTYGDLVEAEETFTYHAGRLLGLASYNYGVCSYSYVSSLLKLVDLEDNGVLDKLAPSILILGAGGWLEERSLTPFYPTGGLPFGYAFLDKKGNSLFIRQPDDIYSVRHLFEFRKKYFPSGIREAELTPERKRLIKEIIPRVLAAIRDKENRPKSPVTSEELYNFIIARIHQIALAHRMQFVVFWLPSRRFPRLSSALTHVLGAYDDITLVDGTEATKNKPSDQVFSPDGHPTALAHRELARLVVAELKGEKQMQQNHD